MAPGPAPRDSGVGCATMIGIAFGVVMLLGLVTCGGAAYWTFSPGKQAEATRLVGEESLGYVQIADLASAEPVATLLRSVLAELERRDPSNAAAPEWLRGLQGAGQNYQAMLDYMMPNALVLTLEPSEDGFAWMTAANFPSFTRPANLVLKSIAEGDPEGDGPAASALAYGDVTIYEFPETASLAFLGGTFVAAGATPSTQKAVDRLRAEEPQRAPLLELEVPRSGSWDARGAFSGPTVLMLGIGPDLATLARLGLRMDDPDTATGYLVVDCPGEGEAASLEEALGMRLADSAADLSEQGLEVTYTVVRKASAVDVDLKLEGVREYLLSQLEPAEDTGAELPQDEMAPEDVPQEEEPVEEELPTGAESTDPA